MLTSHSGLKKQEIQYTCNLSPKFRKIAEIELNETEETRNECLKEFRNWILKNPLIKYCNTDPKFLLRFLRTKKFSVTRACETLEKYLTAQHTYPEWYRNLDCDDARMEELLDLNYICPLKERDSHGRRILLARPHVLDPNQISSLDLFRFHLMVIEYLMNEEETQVSGILAVADTENCSWSHIRLYNLGFLKTTFSILQEATPLRVNEMNTINMPSYFRVIANFLLSFLNEKMRKRFRFTSHHSIDLKLMPKEYGGEVPMSEMVKEFKENLRQYRQNILDNDKNSIILNKKSKKAHKSCLKANPNVAIPQLALEVD